MFKFILYFLFSILAFNVQAAELLQGATETINSSLLGLISFFTPLFILMGIGLIVMSFFMSDTFNVEKIIPGIMMLVTPVAFKMLIPMAELDGDNDNHTSLWENIFGMFTINVILCIGAIVNIIVISIVVYMRMQKKAEYLLLQRKREQHLYLLSKVSDLYIINYDLITKKHGQFKFIMENLRNEKKKFDSNHEYVLKEKREEEFNKFLQSALSCFGSSGTSAINLKK